VFDAEAVVNRVQAQANRFADTAALFQALEDETRVSGRP
jgi:hypothetical protein